MLMGNKPEPTRPPMYPIPTNQFRSTPMNELKSNDEAPGQKFPSFPQFFYRRHQPASNQEPGFQHSSKEQLEQPGATDPDGGEGATRTALPMNPLPPPGKAHATTRSAVPCFPSVFLGSPPRPKTTRHTRQLNTHTHFSSNF